MANYIQSETNHIKETVNYLGNIFSEILIYFARHNTYFI